MITVSSGFKTAMKANAKELSAYITDNDTIEIRDNDDLKELEIKNEGDLFGTVLRLAKATYFGNEDLLGKEINIYMGVKVGAGFEYINYGTFLVVQQEKDKETELTTITAYDKMYEMLKMYKSVSVGYPVTIKGFLEKLCSEFNCVLATSSFFNDSIELPADLFVWQSLSYRNVLDYIAEITASVIYFNNENKLVVKNIGDISVETLIPDNVNKMKLENKWGGVNSVVLANTPTERNFIYDGGYYNPPILLENGEELLLENGDTLDLEVLSEIDGLYQIRFENNLICYDDREDFLSGLSGELTGFEYYPFELETVFLGYFEIGDKIIIKDINNNEYPSYILGIDLSLKDGAKEVLTASVLGKSRTGVKKSAGIVEQGVMKTEIGTDNIKDNSVTSVKIQDASITNAKIQDASITSAKVRELSVDKLSTGQLQVGTEFYIADDEGKVLIYIANVEVEE